MGMPAARLLFVRTAHRPGTVLVRAGEPARSKKISRQKSVRVMSNLMTIKGYVTPVPRAADPRQARVAVRQQDDEEYRIVPRGAGVDLDDEVSVPVEVTGIVDELDGVRYLMVRGYKVLEDDTWLD